jgi:hypothetical protein
MAEKNTCPSCGAELPSDAPSGLCVPCLLRGALPDGAVLPPSDQGDTHSQATTASPPLSEKPGGRIGRYKLLEKIGEGGCGVVYGAEQEQPVRRRVALKVIKLGMDTRQDRARQTTP